MNEIDIINAEVKRNRYFRIRLQGVSVIEEDVLSSLVFEYGASGISEALSFAQSDLSYEPQILRPRTHDLDVFFPNSPEDEFFTSMQRLAPQVVWQVFEEETKDWMEEWKKSFKPFPLVGSTWIVPSWEPIPEACERPIYIDPGMAFGTGTHATTQMASYFVHKLSIQVGELAGAMSLLDIGTGTGILAILAQLSGFHRVVGIEIDPEARRVARENIQRNTPAAGSSVSCERSSIVVSDLALDELREKFDVVIANIVDGVLITLRKDILKCLNPGGYLFVTGILSERDTLFFEKFIENSDLQVIRRLEKDEWVGYWLKSTIENGHEQKRN